MLSVSGRGAEIRSETGGGGAEGGEGRGRGGSEAGRSRNPCGWMEARRGRVRGRVLPGAGPREGACSVLAAAHSVQCRSRKTAAAAAAAPVEGDRANRAAAGRETMRA